MLRTCPRCGARSHLADARFCWRCGATLAGDGAELPQWQQPPAAKYDHVVMNRMALSCPECGEPMRFGFRRVCRRCGAQLVMLPRILHPNHMRIFVRGPRAALYELAIDAVGFGLAIGVMMLFGHAFK